MPRKITESDITHMINLYESGMGFMEISMAMGVGYVTAYRYVTDSGITKRTKSEVNRLAIQRGRLEMPIRKGNPIPDELTCMYSDGWTVRELASKFRISTDRVSQHLIEHGVKLDAYQTTIKRHGIEATLEKIRNAARKDSKIRHTQAIREQIANTRQERLSAAGSCEVELFGKLQEFGMNVTQQRAIGCYNLDISLDEFNIAIEIERGSWGKSRSMLPHRLEYLFSSGWKMIIVRLTRNVRTFIDFNAIAKQCIAFAQIVRSDPSAIGEYGVIGCKGKMVTSAGSYLDTWTRVSGF